MTRDEVLTLIRDHLADELSSRSGGDHGDDALPGGPLGGLAGPLLARAGAGGHLRPEDVRRGSGAHPDRRPGRGLRPGPRPVGTLTAAQAPRPARAAAGRSRPAGGHAFVVDGEAVGFLRAARLPGRFRARPGGHDAPLSAPAAGRLRRRAADEGPRAGGLAGARAATWRSGWGSRSGCATRRRPSSPGPATEQLARTERVLASVIEAVIGACYLEFGYEEVADAVVEAFTPEIERALAHPADFKSRAAGAARPPRHGRHLRDRRGGGPAARADLRGRRDGRGRGAGARHRPLEEGRRAGRRRGRAGILSRDLTCT